MQIDEPAVLPELPAADSKPTKVLRPLGFLPQPVPQLDALDWPWVRGYEILSVIGSGGMGIVYKARQRDLHRTVALKMLRGATVADPEFHQRFRAEAEAVARLQHPNIIQVFEIGAVEAQPGDVHPSPFISLEFVSGGSLTQYTDSPQPARYAAEMVEKLARAAHSAHRLGVVHRDLKPANVLLTHEGEPKIADFGLAKNLATERDDGGRFLTQAGIVVGTPEYMAPEQAMGDAATPAIDIYALGVILYELLTARVPFRAASPIETMHLAQHQDPVPPRQLQPDLPRDLETICLKCLEKDPGKRYVGADALADDLRRHLDDQPIQARRMTDLERLARGCRRNPLVAASLAGVVGIFLVAFVLVTWSYWRVDAALQEEAHQRQEAERKENAERWERYRANIVATASALQVYNVGGARRSLEDAPQKHRNWEWRHFHSRLDLAQHSLRADDAQATAGAILANAERVIMIHGGHGFVRLWDTVARKELRTFHDLPNLDHVVLSPDGKVLASFSNDHVITLHDIDAGQIRATLRGHNWNITSMQFSADAARFVSCSGDGNVQVWDPATGRSLGGFRPYEKGVESIVLSPNGHHAVIVDSGRRHTGLWDLDTHREIATLPGLERGLYGVGFNPRGDRFVTIERFPTNELRLWNAVTGELISVMGCHTNAVSKVAFSSDGSRIATSSMDQTVRLWDGVTGKPLAVLKGHNGRVTRVAFSPSGKQLVSASEDHTLRLWDAAAGEPLAVLNGHTAAVFGVAYAADGNRVVSASEDGTIRLWDVQTAQSGGVLRGHTNFAYSVAVHPDGDRIASAAWDGTVRIWNATTGKQMLLLDHGESKIVTAVAIHPAGRLLASRARGAVFLWDIESGRQLHRWDAPSSAWKDTRLAFSPDGNLLATGCDNHLVRLWDVNSRAEVAVLHGHRDDVRDLAFSPDGKWLATAAETYEKSIRIWNVATTTPVQVLEGHKDCVYCLAFSPDGKQLASGSIDGTARLWDAATWQPITVLKHGAKVYGVTFNPDGTRLACACSDNSIRFWDAATHQSVAELRGHTDYVHAIAFTPDGTRLASASGDFTVRVWDTVRPHDRASGR